MQILENNIKPADTIPNIATLICRNAKLYADNIVFSERKNDHYEGISWKKLHEQILTIAFNLQNQFGFKPGDKIIVFSPNRTEMLLLELAVMASGGIAVPIFAWFHQETAELLIRHSNANILAVAGELQLSRISKELNPEYIIVFDEGVEKKFRQQHSFSELLTETDRGNFSLNTSALPDEVCLNMYTSGTMGVPKCVQLMHKNILSQQAAISQLWNLDSNNKFLSYLPWHHSFGGIFELFTALYCGASIYLESGYGKNPEVIMENWKLVQPTVFFSVPKVYQSLFELTTRDKEVEKLFFHPGLKFIFTAAASLPQKLSDEFEKRNIPVIEGWGLTETSPCCTLTDPKKKRQSGVVGFPIPGVTIRITDDGEIQVKGPNVMKGYYRNDEANKEIFTEDGFFCTGDIGEFTPDGVKLISRKDRIFKLSNGEKVIPSDMEKIIEQKCHYISFAMVVGNGKEYPVALLFPNKKLLKNPDYSKTPDEGCFCPRNINELGNCLHGCLQDANCGIGQKFSKIKAAMIIDDELSLEKNTLTPSMKASPKNVVNAYKAHLENLYGAENEMEEEVYIIRLEGLPETIKRTL